MKAEVRCRPSFAHVHFDLGPGEKVIAEAGAMASMSTGVQMQTRWNGGFFPALLKFGFGGETLFVNEFSTMTGGELILTQDLPGDVECIELRDEVLYLQPGAFIACEPGVTLGVGWAGFASWIGREGLFRLRLGGRGRVWFGAYGGIFARTVRGEEVVDTGHLVGYEPTVSLRMGMAGGLFSSIFSGEGLVTRVSGSGRIYLQSRSFDGLVAWTNSHL